MPIIIPKNLPAHKIMNSENVFVMTRTRAQRQDIRPLRIALLNLMPTKVETETQLIRMLANTPLQVELVLLYMSSHISKNISYTHLNTFYKTFSEIEDQKFDGMIITGAPVENLDFEDVDYWPELCRVMDYSRSNVFSTLHICWGAQAALYHHYGIQKYVLPQKLFGVYTHKVYNSKARLLRGFDDEFYAIHSRHAQTRREDIKKIPSLELMADSEEAGPFVAASKNRRQIFVLGHAEYDKYTLKDEYERDFEKDPSTPLPQNYFVNDDPFGDVVVRWKSHANLLFSNWLNYYVYQETPFDIDSISD